MRTGVLSSLTVLLSLLPGARPRRQHHTPDIQFTRFASADGLGSSTLGGGVVDGGNLALAPNEESGTWQSPVLTPGFGFTRLVASWNADTPGNSRLRVEAQVATQAGASSDWYVLGIWAADAITPWPGTSVNAPRRMCSATWTPIR